MDNRTIGNLISGFGAKALAAGVALYVASEAIAHVLETFGQVQSAFTL